jgi:hypothetical protein
MNMMLEEAYIMPDLDILTSTGRTLRGILEIMKRKMAERGRRKVFS